MHRMVQKFRGKIYLIGILLFLFVVNATAQFEEGALVKRKQRCCVSDIEW